MGSSRTALRSGRPIWLSRRHPRQHYRSLSGRQECDVAIVGGGATGSTVAALFASSGISVALVDAGLVGCGSTAASSALLLQEPDLGMAEMSERFGSRRTRRTWQLSASAVGEFVDLLKRFSIDCNLTRQNSVYCTTTDDGVRMLQREWKRRRGAGFEEDWLTPGALRRLTGIAGRGALLTTGNAQIDPYRASVGLIKAAVQHGAQVFERSRVRRINQHGHGVRLLGARGSIDARAVIIATGYATREFRPLAGHFRMDRTYVLATTRITARQTRELGLSDVMLWDTERPYHYARWTPDRRLLLGGGDRPVVKGSRRASAFARGTREVRAYFESLLPALSEIGIEYAWEGLFARTPDSLPYVGPHHRYPRHLFALGYGGNGMTFGFLAARMLLEQWQGARSSDHALFAFGRGR